MSRRHPGEQTHNETRAHAVKVQNPILSTASCYSFSIPHPLGYSIRPTEYQQTAGRASISALRSTLLASSHLSTECDGRIGRTNCRNFSQAPYVMSNAGGRGIWTSSNAHNAQPAAGSRFCAIVVELCWGLTGGTVAWIVCKRLLQWRCGHHPALFPH